MPGLSWERHFVTVSLLAQAPLPDSPPLSWSTLSDGIQYSFVHFIHSFFHSFFYSLIHSFIHLSIQSLSPNKVLRSLKLKNGSFFVAIYWNKNQQSLGGPRCCCCCCCGCSCCYHPHTIMHHHLNNHTFPCIWGLRISVCNSPFPTNSLISNTESLNFKS